MVDVYDLERNDVAGAVAFVEGLLDAEQDLPADDAEVLLMLQDDAAELVDALEALYRRRQARGLAVPRSWEE